MTSGARRSDLTDLTTPAKLKEFLDHLKESYDYVVLDTPPIQPVSDTLFIGQATDHNLLIARSKISKLAGIKSGDVIIKFDNKDVKDMRSLPRIVAETEIDKPVSVEVWRNGMPIKLQVIVGEMIEEEQVSAKKPMNNSSESLEIEELGLLLSNISDDLRSKFGIPTNLNGVLILNVRSETDASDKGILPGDIIIEVSQNKVFSPSDVEMRVDEEIKSSRDFALLLINRKGDIDLFSRVEKTLKIKNKFSGKMEFYDENAIEKKLPNGDKNIVIRTKENYDYFKSLKINENKSYMSSIKPETVFKNCEKIINDNFN